MINTRWYTHPFAIFCFTILALGSALTIYITTFIKIDDAFSKFIKQQNLDVFYKLSSTAWVTIIVLSILFALVACGLVLVYIYYKKVVELYHMQKNFLNGFTHELKTPVTSLKLFIETLSLHELPREEQLKCIEFMKKDTDRLSHNISQILNLGKMEDKKYSLDLSKIYLSDFLPGIVRKNAHTLKDVDIKITGAKDVVVFADYALFESLVMNLLSNAVVYNDKDKVKIVIHITDMKDEVKISFSDNGIGLQGADKNKIFKKYYRVKKVVKGSGIGLYLAQHIAKLHKGSLTAESSGEGKGSVFYMKFKKGSYYAI